MAVRYFCLHAQYPSVQRTNFLFPWSFLESQYFLSTLSHLTALTVDIHTKSKKGKYLHPKCHSFAFQSLFYTHVNTCIQATYVYLSQYIRVIY